MKVDPARDNIEELWQSVRDVKALDALAAIETPIDWSPIIRRNLSHLAFDLWGHTDYEAQCCLDRIADHYGGRLTSLPPDDVAQVIKRPGDRRRFSGR